MADATLGEYGSIAPEANAPRLRKRKAVIVMVAAITLTTLALALGVVGDFLVLPGTTELVSYGNGHTFPNQHDAAMNHEPPAKYVVDCVTDVGDFNINVTTSWAPLGSKRFYNLVLNHFYDDNYFFRYAKDFVIQWGLRGIVPIDQAYKNAVILDDPVLHSNRVGYVTFADAGPNSRNTQIFVNLVHNRFLDPKGFAPFGQIGYKGMQTIEKINPEYAEQADQTKIMTEGNDYIKKNFPNMSYIKTCRLRAD